MVATGSSRLFGGPSSLSEDRTGSATWRERTRVLWQYLRRDMRDAHVQRKLLYPKTHSQHVQRTVPFVWALARELATAYIQEPGRRWTRPDGKPLSDRAIKAIERVYREAKVNRIMRNAHRQLVALNNATVWSWPDSRRRTVRLVLVPPHEQEVEMGAPWAISEDDARVWRFRVPMPVPGSPDQLQLSVAEITPTRAVWIDAASNLQGKGVYTDDATNPWGLIPVAQLRGSEPAPGEWWAPVPGDLILAQRAIDHDSTDVGTIARLQGFGQPVFKGSGPKDGELEMGPETAIICDIDGNFSYAQADPKLEGYVQTNKEYLSSVIAMNGLNPATFMKSPGITALAKQMELIDRESYRREHMEVLRDAEQRIYDVIRLQINWLRAGGQDLLPEARVEVEYREPVMPVDPLHDMQALQIAIKLHQTSEARARALRDGISVEAAQERIAEEIANAPGAAANDDTQIEDSDAAVDQPPELAVA